MKLGVCYYPEHWPESWCSRDAARMVELGISCARIGEFAWSRIEPERGKFDFEWLDRAVECLHSAGLRIVMGTPTAAPPKWLVDEYPSVLPHGADGKSRRFGSRRHCRFSSRDWLRESRRIVEIVAHRYGNHPGIVGWQTDNEYGCHGTTLSWGLEDRDAFREWLAKRYATIEALNTAWANVFWSQEVTDFDQVELTNLTVAEANPAARLDFWEFSSSQVASYNRAQCDLIRRHSPGRWITHNFMGFANDFDHWKVADDLDFVAWDSYPIESLSCVPFFTGDEKLRFAETSHPDIASFHHDLYRALGRGRFWIMEQQPGPVNWADWNPVPKPGMVRLWTWEAFAHGADVVSYFRWRQADFAQEQHHTGLNLPHAHELSPGGHEVQQVSRDLQNLDADLETVQAPVTIVHDFASYWALQIQPQGDDYRFEEIMFRWYEAVRRLGIDVDFVRPGADLKGYKLVLAPALVQVDADAIRAFESADGLVLYGPRCGSRCEQFKIPANLPPGPLGDLTGVCVIQVASLRPGLEFAVSGSVNGKAICWREYVETSAETLASFANGGLALTAKHNHHYLACWPDADLLNEVIAMLATKAGLHTTDLPDFIRLRRRGDVVFAFNYGTENWNLPDSAQLLFGERTLRPQDFAAFSYADPATPSLTRQ
ncbi:beta-galactosidase [Agrobacterium vitis]|uniref:Beta-galactosidase n=1 Tax=Agrobacterium vitis TaxID=373 RepID=A0AAE4WCS4_AGRVI|nr:beta-galactosidase [Agrobacterium vitis]MCF1500079.1 beta-galactosidase [Allorhizobium sp. Av2]MCM2442236.1 beta-galactosidase [Agrobacterium vitis]MUZ58646.1 beta-galactosidase [Agrobacterium vitis]MVA66281.1 beta-galactosidase [Agrobacterium vitis]MVA88318.1 beta-galactosidase [Agrobacterium vitis]